MSTPAFKTTLYVFMVYEHTGAMSGAMHKNECQSGTDLGKCKTMMAT